MSPASQPNPHDITEANRMAAQGNVVPGRTAGVPCRVTVTRALRVQLDDLAPAAARELRSLAAEAARFNNAMVGAWYAEALGYRRPEGPSAFSALAGRLSGDVRVALAREAFTQWSRHRARVLRGDQRLPSWSADRALVCRASHMSHGREQRHAWIERDEAGRYWLTARLYGAAHGDRFRAPLCGVRGNDDYVLPTLGQMADGALRLLKVTFVFDRRGKVHALLAYRYEVLVLPAGERRATLGPIESDGALWLRVETADGKVWPINQTPWVSRMLHMREHWDGLVQRLRRRVKRSGPGSRSALRRALVKQGSFAAWAHGHLHEWSRELLATLERHGIGRLTVAGVKHQDLPMHALLTMLQQKGAPVGIAMTETVDPDDPTAYRALAQPVARKGRSIAARRKALRTLREGLNDTTGGTA